MNKAWGRVAGVVLACCLAGCAISEREALERMDLTHEVVRQSTDLLSADRELSRYPIVVDGFKGAMRVKGRVDTEAQKARAARIVWSVRGVKSVENKICVDQKPAPDETATVPDPAAGQRTSPGNF